MFIVILYFFFFLPWFSGFFGLDYMIFLLSHLFHFRREMYMYKVGV